MRISQVHTMSLVFGILLAWSSICLAQQPELPNECERGVKRHHPSQANVYQVFTRQDYRKQWLDIVCPEYAIFDPQVCQCVDSPGQEPPRPNQRTRPQKLKSRQRRPDPPRQNEGAVYEDVKDNHSEGAISKSSLPEQGKTDDRPQQQQKQDKKGQQQQQQQQAKEYEGSPVYEIKQESFQPRDTTEASSPRTGKQKSETDCYLHRPAGDPSLFERWADGQWIEEDCNWPFYTGLVWSQASCRCVWGPNRTVAVPNVEESIPATCLLMLKMTFDAGHIKDEGRHIWLNIRNKENAAVESDSTAVGGKCGSFRGSSIAIPYFKSNVLGEVFHIGFMFKLCPGDPDTDIPLVHNDCLESREDGPGIVVTYQAWRKQIVVSLRTVNSPSLVSEYCNLKKPQSQWTKIDIRYSDNLMEVRADDDVCVESNKYFGVVATNNCPLILLGEAFCGSLDEVVITRGCTKAHAVS